jgi:hypothetical protein
MERENERKRESYLGERDLVGELNPRSKSGHSDIRRRPEYIYTHTHTPHAAPFTLKYASRTSSRPAMPFSHFAIPGYWSSESPANAYCLTHGSKW